MFVVASKAINIALKTKSIKNTFIPMGDTFWNIWQFSKQEKSQLLKAVSQHQFKI